MVTLVGLLFLFGAFSVVSLLPDESSTTGRGFQIVCVVLRVTSLLLITFVFVLNEMAVHVSTYLF